MGNYRKPVWQTLGLGAVAGVRASAAPAIANYYSNGYYSSPLKIVRFAQSPITSLATSLFSAVERERNRSGKRTQHIDVRQLGLHIASGAFAGAAIFKKNKQSMFKGMLIGGTAALITGVAGFYLRRHANKLPDTASQFVGAFQDAFAYSTGIALVK